MSSGQSYLAQLNAGRQRRAHGSMEQLNRSLETLEQHIGRASDRQPERRDHANRDPLPPIDTGRWEPPARRIEPPYEPRRPEPRASDKDAAWRGEQSHRGDPSYRTLARDFERLRGQEDSVAAVGKIAGELKGLREELRQQMTTGLKREFDGLRKDIERAYSTPMPAVRSAELTAEFDRLSGAIQSLSEKTDDK